MEYYINSKQQLQNYILEYIESSDENDEKSSENFFSILSDFINQQQIDSHKEEMKKCLHIIQSISENHHQLTKVLF